MATNRVIPPSEEQLAAETTAEEARTAQTALKQKQEEKLTRVVWAGSVALIIIGVVVMPAIFYFAKLVLVTLLVSILIAFMLEPLVNLLQRVRLPRSAAAFMAVLVLGGCLLGCKLLFLLPRGRFSSAAAQVHAKDSRHGGPLPEKTKT